MSTVEKWREAHPDLVFPEVALKTVAPFPSLAITDFIHYLESRAVSDDVISFLKDVSRELWWLYGNWSKEQFNRDGVKLMDDLVRNIPKGDPHADFLFRWIRDYRDAHNLNWADPKKQSSWEEAMRQPMETVATGETGVVGGNF